MEKFFPPKPPLEMILPAAVDKLLTLFGRNGYNNVAITLIVHNMDDSETSLAANLNTSGTEALLSSALNKINSDADDVPTH